MYGRQHQRGGGAQMDGRQIALPEPGDLGQMVLSGAKNFARNLPFARMWFWKDDMNAITRMWAQ